jgi:hypothetical protein
MAVLVIALLTFLILIPVVAAWAAHKAGMLPSESKILKLVMFPLSRTLRERGRRQRDKSDAA